MGDREQDPFHSFQAEADEHLFADLRMDDALRNTIKQSVINAEQQGRKGKRWRRIAGTATAAVVLGVAIALSLQIPDSNEVQTTGRERPEQGSVSTPETMMGEPDSTKLPTTFVDTEDTGLAANEQTFSDIAAAEAWFGQKLRLPSAVPDQYELLSITGVSNSQEVPLSITMLYASANQQFSISNFALANPLLHPHGEEVELDGFKGEWVQSNPVELYWSVEDIQYRLTGDLSREEALSVALSLNQE